ncbi:MAG: hypothetical protein ABL971_11655 [Vicinamibacterales bacterium]
MMLLWMLASLSMVVAAAAWAKARRASRRLAQLTEQFWELKYQHGELRVQMARYLAPDAGPVPPPRPPATEGFIPLASLKR